MGAVHHRLAAAGLLLCVALAARAQAQGGEALLQTHGCLSCHAKAEKVVGPSFLSIAEKYRGDKDAPAALAQAIRNGSKGTWGRIPMPSHPNLGQEDLQALVRHVLATAR